MIKIKLLELLIDVLARFCAFLINGPLTKLLTGATSFLPSVLTSDIIFYLPEKIETNNC